MADDDQVILQSGDGSSFKVLVGDAKLSKTITCLIEDCGIEEPIPIPNVTGKELERIVAYMRDKELPEKLKTEESVRLTENANFLDIPCLLEKIAHRVALSCIGKTADEVFRTFRVSNKFDKEEEKEAKELADTICVESEL